MRFIYMRGRTYYCLNILQVCVTHATRIETWNILAELTLIEVAFFAPLSAYVNYATRITRQNKEEITFAKSL